MKRKRLAFEELPSVDEVHPDSEEEEQGEVEREAKRRRVEFEPPVSDAVEAFVARQSDSDRSSPFSPAVDDDDEEDQDFEFASGIEVPGDVVDDHSDDVSMIPEDDEDVVNKPEAGIIEEIELQDFICHSHAVVKLKSHINIITGPNGSGKTAILTGIMVCFGCRRARGAHALKDYIREGCSSCSVKVTLRNKGIDAYRSRDFGNHIVVRRTINDRGASSSQLCREDGSVVENGRRAVDVLLSHFNIQVENPCVILQQSQAKTFLLQARPQDKYRFFLEASQLQAMLDDFERVKTDARRMELMLEVKEEKLREEEEIVLELKSRVEMTRDLVGLNERKKQLLAERAWACVRDVEKEISALDAKIQEHGTGLEEVNARLAQARTKSAEIQAAMRQAQEALAQSMAERDRLRNERRSEEEARERILYERADLDAIVEDLGTNMRNVEMKITAARGHIREEREREVVDNSEEMIRVRRQKEEVEVRMAELRREESELEKNMADLDRQKANYQEDLARAENVLRAHVDRIATTQGELRRLKQQQRAVREQRSRISFFESGFPNRSKAGVLAALKLINRSARLFKKFPIGPIALFLDVTDPKYAIAAEQYLSNRMQTFIVNSYADEDLLKRLLRENRLPRVNVFVYKFRQTLYDSSQIPTRRRDGLVRLFDALKIDTRLARQQGFRFDPATLRATIFGCLVDSAQIELAVLCDDDEKARDLMFNKVRPPPRGVARALGPYGKQFSRLTGGATQVDSADVHHSAFWGSLDLAAQIAETEVEIRRMKDEEPSKRDTHAEWRRKVQEVEHQIRDTERKVFTMGRQIGREERGHRILDRKLQELLVPVIDSREANIKKFEDFILKYEDDLAKSKLQMAQRKEEQEEYAPRIAEAQTKIDQIKVELLRVAGQIREMQDQRGAASTRLTPANREVRTASSEVQRLEALLGRLQSRRDESQSQLDSTLETAREVSPNRVETDKSLQQLEELERELDRLRAQERARLQGKSVEEINAEAKAAERDFNRHKEYCEDARRNLECCKRGYQARYKRWRVLRDLYGTIAAQSFDRALSRRKHSGLLTFDHDNHQLLMDIALESSDGHSVQEAKRLSGGERAFATVALVGSMWGVAESPFRCFDEIDIFMDEVNRRYAIETLLEMAMDDENENRQLILLTPQETSQFTMKDENGREHVHKIRLRPPGGQTLMDDHLI